jgi:hypothetical protein
MRTCGGVTAIRTFISALHEILQLRVLVSLLQETAPSLPKSVLLPRVKSGFFERQARIIIAMLNQLSRLQNNMLIYVSCQTGRWAL